MAKAIKGIYEKGMVRLSADPQVPEGCEVYVVFPEEEKEWTGIPTSAFRELDAIVAWGGDAVADAERLYGTPTHHLPLEGEGGGGGV